MAIRRSTIHQELKPKKEFNCKWKQIEWWRENESHWIHSHRFSKMVTVNGVDGQMKTQQKISNNKPELLGKYDAFEMGLCHIVIENIKNQNRNRIRNRHSSDSVQCPRVGMSLFFNQMHWKCQLVYTIIMFCKHPAAWLVIKTTTIFFALWFVDISRCDRHVQIEWTFSSDSNNAKWNYSTTKYLHSSQLSLPFRMQRFFLFLIQFSLHVKQNPLLVHVSHPVGHGIHSWRFLSP